MVLQFLLLKNYCLPLFFIPSGFIALVSVKIPLIESMRTRRNHENVIFTCQLNFQVPPFRSVVITWGVIIPFQHFTNSSRLSPYTINTLHFLQNKPYMPHLLPKQTKTNTTEELSRTCLSLDGCAKGFGNNSALKLMRRLMRIWFGTIGNFALRHCPITAKTDQSFWVIQKTLALLQQPS